MRHFRIVRYIHPESIDSPAREWPTDHLRLVEDICGVRWLERWGEGEWLLLNPDEYQTLEFEDEPN